MAMFRSIAAGALLASLTSTALAQVIPNAPAPQAGPLVLNLGAPYEGAACGAVFQPDWNLDLDRVVGFAESQLSACDLALTLAAIEGHVATAGTAIAAAHTENWNAWMAAEAFLPQVEEAASADPVSQDRRARVHEAQDKIQSARNGLRFLAKLAAVIQFPPPPRADLGVPAPETVGRQESIERQDLPAAETPPETATETASDTPSELATEQSLAAAEAPFGARPAPALVEQGLVACVTPTAWVLAPRPAQNRPERTIDDPVAGEAFTWIMSRTDASPSAGTVHAFAACPGAQALPVAAAAAPLPGAAQGLTPALREAAPAEPLDQGENGDLDRPADPEPSPFPTSPEEQD